MNSNKVDPNLVKYFCSYGIDLSCTDYRDVSVLHAAAWNPSSTADVFQTLIDYGVNINKKNKRGYNIFTIWRLTKRG